MIVYGSYNYLNIWLFSIKFAYINWDGFTNEISQCIL